jgi:hypothetical protein
VAVGDFNGDGILDLAVANNGLPTYTNGSVSVLLGKGDGTFLPAVTYDAGIDPTAVAVGDFNGDGIPDLAVANSNYPYPNGTVSVLLGKGDGTFLPAQSFPVGSVPASVAVGDFNGDGHLDLAVANVGSDAYGRPNVSVLLGNGDGTFQPALNFSAGAGSRSIAVGDFNGDGRLDLAVPGNYYYPGDGDGSHLRVLLGSGSGTFYPAPGPFAYSVGPGPSFVAVGDFNGDGLPDLAVADAGAYPQYAGTVSILLGKGDGTFQPGVTYDAGYEPMSVAVGDFNGDGKQDLVVANSNYPYINGTVSVLLGKGDGTFLPVQPFGSGVYAISAAVGDFNGDGFPDLAVVGSDYSGNGKVSILLNDTSWPPPPGGPRNLAPLPGAAPPPMPGAPRLPARDQLPLADSALAALALPPGSRAVAEPPTPLSPPGTEPAQASALALLPDNGKPLAVQETVPRPFARGAPLGLVDRFFADLGEYSIWDNLTGEGIPPPR